ncbi:MAG TPA: hypothetical protein VEM40_05625 [Nitrospirota bacterium]|nr:hypothetical protein [Nitrospirota bacterium]
MRRFTCLLISAFLLSGCATAKITAYRNPEFATRQFTALVVFAHGMAPRYGIEFERQMCKELAPTPCNPGTSVLPPTIQAKFYTADEVAKYLQDSGADAILVVVRVDDQSETQYFGTISDLSSSASATASGSLNFYKNVALWGGADDSVLRALESKSGYQGVAYGQLGLFDRQSGNIAWLGKTMVGGRSIDSTTPEAFMYATTSKIARELKAAGFVK